MKVAITGIGAVTPVGHTAEETWMSLKDGIGGIGALDIYDSTTFTVKIAGLVRDFHRQIEADTLPAGYASRAAQFGLTAAEEALSAASLDEKIHSPHRRGVFVGGHIARPDIDELARISLQPEDTPGRWRDPAGVRASRQSAEIAAIADLADADGPLVGISTACASSAHAIGEAYERIRTGEITAAIAGGQDSLTTWLDVSGFTLLGALTMTSNDTPTSASRPFDRTRDGFVLGEGAVYVVLEDGETAQQRGASILGWIEGYASSMNAYRITDAPPDGGRSINAMRNALIDASVSPSDVDIVVAHGTSTPGNDISETAAIQTVFNEHANSLLVTAPKSMTGHLTAAAGALNLLVAIYASRDSLVPPTINLTAPDPELPLDYVPNTARSHPAHTFVVNAFAFGGTNASMIVKGASTPTIKDQALTTALASPSGGSS